MKNIDDILEVQRNYYSKIDTNNLHFRINNLKKLKKLLLDKEEEILKALKEDLGKSYTEAYMTELGLVIDEINFTCKNLKKWSKPKKVKTNILNFKSKSYTIREAYGNTLIIAPWNYPILLTLSPLVGSLAGGNTAIIKPSELAKKTSILLEELINNNFNPGLVHVINGEVQTNQYLLKQRFDYIFFTGSSRVGKIVMAQAAQHLTPVTLELGGKSPCIVDKNSNLSLAAKRIVWGKFTNAGQTCVAPDYILVDKSVKNQLVDKIIYFIEANTLKNIKDYPKIINEKHFNRLISYTKNMNIIYERENNRENLIFYPMLISNPPLDSPLMEEEIFGPILPIISYENVDELIDFINSKEKPLALYVFSNSKAFYNNIITSISFGGGAINDTLMHLANPNLPFGGVGFSGMGKYHGKHSFHTFTHEKGILDKSTLIDIPLRYPPFKDKLKWIKKILN